MAVEKEECVSAERLVEFRREVDEGTRRAEKLLRGKRRKINSIIAEHDYDRDELAAALASAGGNGRAEEAAEKHRKVLAAIAREVGMKLPRKRRS